MLSTFIIIMLSYILIPYVYIYTYVCVCVHMCLRESAYVSTAICADVDRHIFTIVSLHHIQYGIVQSTSAAYKATKLISVSSAACTNIVLNDNAM